MRNFLTTTFAGTEGDLDMLLSYVDIADASPRTPDAILVFFDTGGEGKSRLLRDLMGEVWGIGHMVVPPSLLLTPEEFRMKCHLYRGLKWISFDERSPTLGVEEDIFKLFVSGGSLCLGGNREAEIHFAGRPRCGKSWAMRPDGVPHVPCATESAYRRRIRCVRMRARGSPRKKK